jgi:ActR/RegA family two-component response regulator
VLPDAVLLVDDDAVVLDVLAIALKKKQLTVHTATRLAEARELVRTQPLACLLVDKNLDDGSGLDLIEHVRVAQPLCACVVMTGYPNADSILKALRLGAVDYLEKPFPSLAIIQEKVVGLIARARVGAERDALLKKVQELSARGGHEDFQETAQLAMLQHALEVAQEDHAAALATLKQATQQEIEGLTARFEAVKGRHQRALTALRQAAASLANLLEGHRVSGEAERDLREVRRLLTQVLDER